MTTEKQKQRLVWSAVAIAVVLVLGLTPPLLNVNRLRRRIAASMSASIGRPVHLDSVELHLLPVPAFTLTNLVVSEDPAFGNEPVIRAMTVEATLRPSSLWRRQVEFSTIRFIEPSLNLVRNATGEWNLQSLLMHAAQVDTAPTAQRRAGPEPRFPYIEATGARVNLKLGEEKQPFSLTDADFALWLPSSKEWRVRLEARPARTDQNIGDPGTVRVEGSLERAARMAAVPVDLTASWRDAPLGEASKLLTGNDAGWRGTLNVDAALVGTLGAAKLMTGVHINDLRRAEFIPVQSLDLNVDCSGNVETTEAVVHDPECTLRSPRVNANADSVDVTGLAANGVGAVSGLQVGSAGVPERWVLEWARLFSRRIASGAAGVGQISGSMALEPASGTEGGFWDGTVEGEFEPLGGRVPVSGERAAPEEFTIASGAAGAVLEPVNLLAPGKTPPLMLSGEFSRSGYSLNLKGTATAQEIRSLRGMAPPLTDGLSQALGLPESTEAAAKPMKVDVTCTRAWGEMQTCTEVVAAPAKKVRRRRRR